MLKYVSLDKPSTSKSYQESADDELDKPNTKLEMSEQLDEIMELVSFKIAKRNKNSSTYNTANGDSLGLRTRFINSSTID